jgi:predicted AAA+ superfamily ATPase
MKAVLSQLIDDFHARKLPAVSPRSADFPEFGGKASAVIGMRRTGKTFFCFQKMKSLLDGGLSFNRVLYLNFEDDRLVDFTVKDFQAILDVYYGKFPGNRGVKCYFFFDEIQRVDKWEMFIRRLLDTENAQVAVTGSSSKMLSKEIATSLRGRSVTAEIFPFSFEEFLRCRGLFRTAPERFGAGNASILRKAAADYLEAGGFPEIQSADKRMRTEILQGYVDSVVLRDIIERHGVGNVLALRRLISAVMSSSGMKFSVNKFHNTLKSAQVKCSKNDLYEWLEHLFDAYLFFRVPLHSRSEKARSVNPAKIYTADTGLLNAMSCQAGAGWTLENMVFLHLRRKGFTAEYALPRDGGELDFFAVPRGGGEPALVQVCHDISDEKTLARELDGLKNAMTEYGVPLGEIVTWDDEGEPEAGVTVIPAWKWLLK